MKAQADENNIRDIKICHVLSGDLWGGAEAQAFALIQALSNSAQMCAVVFNQGELRSRIEASRILVDVADEKSLGFFRLIFRVYSIFRKWRPDLIHVHGFKENLVGGLAALLLGIPVIRTHHGRGMIGVKKRYTYIERFSAAFLTDKLIAVSEDLSAFLRMNGLEMKNLVVIKNGIQGNSESNQVSSKNNPEHSGDRFFTIGTVGRLVAVKNHRCLLDAFKSVHDTIKHARLIIVGDGPLAKQMESYAAGLGIADKVVFTGFQQDVNKYLNSLDVFVLSSLHEGVPISLLEAMSMNIPVVCTRVGGIPEVIIDRQNGLLVAPNDAESLSAAIVRIAEDKVFAKQLAARAQVTVSSELSFDRCLASTISLYGGMVLR